jgi:hypothetical protein
VPFAKLKTALSLAGVALSNTQLEALRTAYPGHKSPDEVDWRALVADIDAATAAAAAAAAAASADSSSVASSSSYYYGGATTSSSSAARDAAAVAAAVAAARTVLQRKRHDLTDSFADFDKHHVHRVTNTQFLSVLSSAGLLLSRREGQALCRAYAASGSSGSSSTDCCKGMVAYADFCRDVAL